MSARFCKYCKTMERIFAKTDKVEHYQCRCAIRYRWRNTVKTYVTFGQCHRHEVNGKVFDKDTVAVIHAEDQERGRARAFELFGTKFFTTYTEHNWSKEIESYFPKGLVEVE